MLKTIVNFQPINRDSQPLPPMLLDDTASPSVIVSQYGCHYVVSFAPISDYGDFEHSTTNENEE